MSRPLYSDRVVHIVKDFKDQPEGRYCVFVQDVFGEKVVITCDRLDITPVAVICKRNSDKIQEKDGVMIAAIPARDVHWGLIENERVIHMTGEEWEQHKVDDVKNQVDLATKHYGNDKVVKVAILPDGRQVRLPLLKEDETVLEEPAKTTEEKPQSNEAYGVPRTHL